MHIGSSGCISVQFRSGRFDSVRLGFEGSKVYGTNKAKAGLGLGLAWLGLVWLGLAGGWTSAPQLSCSQSVLCKAYAETAQRAPLDEPSLRPRLRPHKRAHRSSHVSSPSALVPAPVAVAVAVAVAGARLSCTLQAQIQSQTAAQSAIRAACVHQK